MTARHVRRLLAVAAVAMSALAIGSSPASADVHANSGLCSTIHAPGVAEGATCLYGVEVGPRNNQRLDIMFRDSPTPDGYCAVVQTKVPGTTSWGTRITNCDAVYRTYSVAVSTFYGKVDVRVCRSNLALCTNSLQLAV